MAQHACRGRDDVSHADTSVSAPRAAHVPEPALDERGDAPEQTQALIYPCMEQSCRKWKKQSSIPQSKKSCLYHCSLSSKHMIVIPPLC